MYIVFHSDFGCTDVNKCRSLNTTVAVVLMLLQDHVWFHAAHVATVDVDQVRIRCS